ncbi:enoyl-CoA hydratase-related protein [Vibrio sp. Of7-15]|uniref:enoyl-CoA hydratase-related protein n=1 Tax=Vibrio sp. Of7-15 TaxID=2724879 RepID=UPI001EF3AFF4|nr:enoyl-CoA hydratase-related protein [Vibrio sp. Of7-15]MCG7500111.1 enoyl-CoA hydratase-related protein [Vibrio sp. Of7-15]
MGVKYQYDSQGWANIQLDRARVHNAFDDSLIADLITAIDKAHQDKARVIVLSSQGRHFSAGADLGWMKSMADNTMTDNVNDSLQLAALMEALNCANMPVIALVQGAAFGGAVGLVACSDVVIAAPDATFCLSEVKLGLIPAVISPYVIKAMGEGHARRYFLTAEKFDAITAQRLGLVHVISENLEHARDEMLSHLMNNSPKALSAAKRLIADVAGQPVDEGLIADTARRIAEIRVSDEGQEGLAAFFEKRPPSWIES